MNVPADTNTAPPIHKLLAHDVRWQILAALAESDRRVQELVELLNKPQNLVSYHLRLLRENQLIREHRSRADGRDVYYTLDLDMLSSRFHESGLTLHPALVNADFSRNTEKKPPYRVLFLCTHNSARSQMAEGILRAYGADSVEVFSAGSHPSTVHPLAIQAAAQMGIDISGQRSKSMEEFIDQRFDAIITVCDQVRETCPTFPHDPRQAHWSIPDPAAVSGPLRTQIATFEETAAELKKRVKHLLQTIQ